MMKIPCLYFTQ